jgi:carbamoyltransferase
MNDIWILGVSSVGHNGSCCLLKNGEIVFFLEEERLSGVKAETMPLLAVMKVKDYTDKLDYLVLDNSQFKNDKNPIIRLCQKLKLIPKDGYPGLLNPEDILHHEAHAASAFYNSGFDTAVCIVVDGAGTDKSWSDKVDNPSIQITVDGVNTGVETESVYKMSYPGKSELLYKKVFNPCLLANYKIDNIHFEPFVGPGLLYSALSTHLGHSPLECGKAMGLSSYGKPDPDLQVYTKDNLVNRNLYLSDTHKFYIANLINFEKYKNEDYCYAVQKGTQQYVLELILNAIKNSGCKNVVLGGGFMLNCVANYEYLNHLPEGTQLYIDPPSSDAGLSIGMAKMVYNRLYPSSPKKQESFYLGPLPDYNFNIECEGFHSKTVLYRDIANLLVEGNIIAMYQGRSEAGPRALGNRSIVFDPRVKDGKDIVNRIKNREWYRPFAGTILKEDVHEWFDMRGLEESPFMMYAVNVLENKKELIPSIVHVDGTCRVQTVTKEQNLHYYNLISEFNKLTNVPILFNTSFNLAGDPLVETMEHALETLRKSEIKYLYLPERSELIWKS